MGIVAYCPHCGQKMNIREASIGTVRKCAACGEKFVPHIAVRSGGLLRLAGLVILVVGSCVAWLAMSGGRGSSPAPSSITPAPPPKPTVAQRASTPAPATSVPLAAVASNTFAPAPVQASPSVIPAAPASQSVGVDPVAAARAKLAASSQRLLAAQAKADQVKAVAVAALVTLPAYREAQAAASTADASRKNSPDSSVRAKASKSWMAARNTMSKIETERLKTDAAYLAAMRDVKDATAARDQAAAELAAAQRAVADKARAAAAAAAAEKAAAEQASSTSPPPSSYSPPSRSSSSAGKTEHVGGYTRKDGTYVKPYNRRPSR